jgi:hypothetical protein
MGLMEWVGAPKQKKQAAHLDARRKIAHRNLNIKRALKGMPPVRWEK